MTVDLGMPALPGTQVNRSTVSEADRERLEKLLRRKFSGDVEFGSGTRAAYASDSSNYRQIPLGVVFPRNEDDVAWALGQVRERFGHLPACLVGHSLGGRAALLAGGAEEVRSVVALNPWVYPTDAPDLSGRRVLFVHGTGDRIADPGRAEAVARRIGRTADMEFVAVPEGRHAMLRHGSVFERAAADFATATLLPKYPRMGEVCP